MARMTKNMPQKQQFTAVVEPPATPAHHYNCLVARGIRLNEDKIPPDIFTDFVKLLYEFRPVFATSMADLKEGSNLLPARIITIPHHKPYACVRIV